MKIIRRFTGVLGFIEALRERAIVRRIRRVSRHLDSFDVIANFSLAVTPLTVRSGQEAETDKIMALPEFAALIFAERSTNPQVDDASGASELAAMYALIPKALFAANMRAMFSLMRTKSSNDGAMRVVPRLTHAAVSREIYLRLPRFHDKEVELLKELFTGDVRQSLVERLGFGAEEMFAAYDSLNSFVAQTAVDEVRAAARELDERIGASPHLQELVENHADGSEEAKKRLAAASAFSNLSSAVSLTFEQIQQRTGIGDGPLRSLLSRLTIDLDATNSGLVREFLAGNNPMRTRPFVSRRGPAGETEWLLVQPTWLVFGMRELFEIELSAKPMDQSYMKLRGELLELRGMRALVGALRPDMALLSVEYVDNQNKRFEADGLLLIGNVAIVLEAKSNRITPFARSGAAERLWLELGPIITKAAEQAERLRKLVLDGSSLHIRNSSRMMADGSVNVAQKNWNLDTTAITEVFTIALSLEDLNFIATITAELVESGLVTGGAPSPWVVNIHDLEIVAELLSRPSEFVHFLSRRRKAANTGMILANDELDYVMHYITMGLYTDGPTDATEMVLSLTDDLDDWYFSKTGQREAAALMPAQPLSADMVDTLDLLDAHRPHGWLQSSLNLLEMDLPLRDQLGGGARRLRAATKKDRLPHSMYLEVAAPIGERFGFVAMSFKPGTSKASMEAQFIQYATLRQYASGLGPVSAFAAWQGSQAPFDIFLHLDSPWVFDLQKDTAVTKSGIQRSGRAAIPLEGPGDVDN